MAVCTHDLAHLRVSVQERQLDDGVWPRSVQPALLQQGDRRLIVRRVRTLDAQGDPLPSWERFPFVTNRTDALAVANAEHRQHAVVELMIRDLKDQALAHFRALPAAA